MAARSAIEWIRMSKALLVFRYQISDLFKIGMCWVFAQQVTNVLRLSPCVVICRNVLYFPLQSSECELLTFLIETLHMCYTSCTCAAFLHTCVWHMYSV